MNFEKLNWTVILSVVVAIEMQIGNGSMSLSHMFPEGWIPYIKAWSANLGSIGATWVAVRAYGTKIVPHDSIAIDGQTPLIFDDKNKDGKIGAGTTITQLASTAKVVGVLIIAIILSSLVFDHAFAQARIKTPQQIGDDIRAVVAPKPEAVQTTVDSAFSRFNADVQKLTREVIDKAIVDVQAALDDAGKHNDEISKPCWQSNLDLLKGLPTQWENPPASIGIALGIQIQRDLLNSITGTDAKSLKVACAALWGDQLKIVTNVGALIGVRVATGGLL